MLNEGIDIDYQYYCQVDRDQYEVSSALIDSCRNNNTDKALWLIAHNANVNIPLTFHNGSLYNIETFALLEATQNNNIQLVSALITAGANIEVKNRNGQTALHIALEKDNQEIIKLLKSTRAKE